MTQLMTIQINSPSICDFNPEPDIHHWNTTSKHVRMPDHPYTLRSDM